MTEVAEVNDGVVDIAEETPAVEEAAKPKATLQERKDAATRLINEQMIATAADIRRAEAEVDDANRELRSAKSNLETQHKRLTALVEQLEDVGRGQLPLPGTEPQAETTADDSAERASVSELDLTASQTEKLIDAELLTVRLVEQALADGKLQSVKGIGQAAVDRIQDAIEVWRDNNGYGQADDEDDSDVIPFTDGSEGGDVFDED